MSGALLLAAMNLGFSATLHIYTGNGASGTETIPDGATTLVIEGWGAGGPGGANHGSSPTYYGGGGGSGCYTRATFSVASANGKTISYTVPTLGSYTGGAGGDVSGTDGSVSSGTFTLDTITLGNGEQGFDASASAGGNGASGGTPTNANAGATNTDGNAGGNGAVSSPANGGAGINGDISGDGSPYGAGGGSGEEQGTGGAIVFYYT